MLTQVGRADFESLTLPHLEAIWRYAFSLTRNAADAEDLVQETYLRALRGWSTFRQESDAARWLFTICRNTFLRLHRRHWAMVAIDDGDLDAMPAALAHARARHDGLEDLFDHLDVRPAIERALDDLSEPHRTILVLVDMEGRSYNEAAAILGVPTTTVRSRLFRARRSIEDALILYAEDAGLRRRAASGVA